MLSAKLKTLLLIGIIAFSSANKIHFKEGEEVAPKNMEEVKATSSHVYIAYFTQWGIYQRNYKVKNIHTSGLGSMLTHINYAFGNIYKQPDGTFKCGEINKLETGQGDGGDAWADFQKGFSAEQSVDGKGDDWGFPWDDPRTGKMGPLKGNFNQLKKLKQLHPQLKVMISLGGWTWSKYFSVAASTDTQRKTLVSSCIDQYIVGNLPFDVGSNAGGQGMLADVFDGVDIDWEYPVMGGLDTNIYSPDDKQNLVLLLKEFREQLDALGKKKGRTYELSATGAAGTEKIENFDVKKFMQYLDRLNIMTYDFRGGWSATGPTNFHSNLYTSSSDPSPNIIERTYSIDTAIDYYIRLGAPPSKLVLGIPLYGRGWTGVAPGPDGNGLYQNATSPAKGTYEMGIEDYQVLKNINAQQHIHEETQALWIYDGNNFWSYDDEYIIKLKIKWLQEKKLGGAMTWSLDGDDADATLSKAIYNNLV